MLYKDYEVIDDSFVELRMKYSYVHLINNVHDVARVVIRWSCSNEVMGVR